MVLEDGPQPVQETLPPEPISAPANLFDLDADPARIEQAARGIREMGERAATARGIVHRAADEVFYEGGWTGDTADSFNEHRRRLCNDLDVVAAAATGAAAATAEVAEVLRIGQGRLDDERDRTAGVEVRGTPVIPGEPEQPSLIFVPKDEAEADRVLAAIVAAQEIRGDVDEQLGMRAGRIRGFLQGGSQYDPSHSSAPSLSTVIDAWKPRDLRVMTYNVGQGYGNTPPYIETDTPSSAGTESHEIPEVGQVIADSDANVVALQEIFKGDAEALVRWLNANTDGEWEMHFERADTKQKFGDQWWDAPSVEQFGNVVLVRKGGDVGDPTQQEGVMLQPPTEVRGNLLGEEGRVMNSTEVPLE